MMDVLLILIQAAAAIFFIMLIWPHIKKEQWRKKFIDNPQAKSILIVFVIIFAFSWGIALFFDWLFPVETVY